MTSTKRNRQTTTWPRGTPEVIRGAKQEREESVQDARSGVAQGLNCIEGGPHPFSHLDVGALRARAAALGYLGYVNAPGWHPDTPVEHATW